MMTVLANIDNRMPFDESHLDPHIEEYIGGWVENKVFENQNTSTTAIMYAADPSLLQKYNFNDTKAALESVMT